MDVGGQRESEERKKGMSDNGLVGENESLQFGKVDGGEVIIIRGGTEVLETEVFYGRG